MARHEQIGTYETVARIAALEAEKRQVRSEVRNAMAAWQAAKHQMAFGLDAEGRIAEVERKLRIKIAAMNGRVSQINLEIAQYREIHKERALRFAAEQDAARRRHREEREVANG